MTPKAPANRIWSLSLGRRQLLKGFGVAGSLMALGGPGRLAEALATDRPVTGGAPGEMPRRALGKTGVQVSALCSAAHIGVAFRMMEKRFACYMRPSTRA